MKQLKKNGAGQTVNPGTDCVVCGVPAVIGSDKCRRHLGPDGLRFKRAMYKFENSGLQQAFDMMLRVDDRTNLESEIALTRTCLNQVVSTLPKDSSKLGPHSIAAITSLSAEITKMADVMARIEQRTKNQVSMETLLFFVQLIGEAVTKIAGPDVSEEIVGAILELPLPQDEGALHSNKPFSRQPASPREKANIVSESRLNQISKLREEAEALRTEIQEADPAWMPDDKLAPPEPEAEE